MLTTVIQVISTAQTTMSVISHIRVVVLSLVFGFSLIALGAAAAAISSPIQWLPVYSQAAGLAIGTATVTLITLATMIIVEFVRPGVVFTSMIVVEVAWFSFLWILWLATGGMSVQAAQQVFNPGCGYMDSVVDGNCRETAAIQALSFLNWLILMGYTILILILAIIASNRKNSVWKCSVSKALFFTPSTAPSTPTVVAAQTSTAVSYSNPIPTSLGGSYPGGTGPASVPAGTIHG
ncbi:hypothetical protein B0H11DRAFT_1336701 [Mycena galericulata]|nr:hypothetical protein B0H11DRAFT_1336701 [Mycena galericulata]